MPSRSLPFLRLWVTLFFLAGFQLSEAAPWFYWVRQADDGLPGDNVTGIVQTRDGYLWIGTQSGLARFDGVKIQSIPLPVGRPHPIIRAMLLDRAERLWLALEGGVVVRYTPKGSIILSTTNGLVRAQPVNMTEGVDGSIWISYLDGFVSRIEGEAGQHFSEESGLTGSGTCSLASDRSGQLWYAKGGQIGIHKDGKFESRFPLSERYIFIEAARSNGIWICAGNRLLKCEGGAPVEVGKIPADAAVVRPTAIHEDTTGAVWIGTAAGGLFRYDGKKIEAVETSHGRIRSVTSDREGNIWVGTDGGGLNRLRHQVVEVQGKDAGLPFDTVRSIGQDAKGRLWVVTQNGDVARNENGIWTTISSGTDWPGGQATCVVCDDRGAVWFGMYSRGVYRWEDGKFTVVRRRDGLAASGVRCLLMSRDGGLWIGFATGEVLQRYQDGKFHNFSLPTGAKAVRTMTEDAKGNIWLANLDAHLFRVSGNELVDETERTTEPYRPIRCLLGTRDGSLWIGYAAVGVGRLKGKSFSVVGVNQGMQDGSICAMMTDGRGWFWFGSDHGIFRVSEADLNAVASKKAKQVRSIGYGKDDGLPSLQGYYGHAPGAARTRDGRVLLPTHSGVAIIYPDRIQTNSVAPPVIIESVVVDGEEREFAATNTSLVLPPDHHKVEISYTAPSFIEAEKVRFRHRLEGWDDNWVEAGTARSATYSRLPANTYRFRVMAGNNANVWSETAASFQFVVEPFFTQTTGFRLGMIVLCVAGTVALVRYFSFRRLRTQVQQLERENALQKERARIAQDIHDDIGARMTQISLLTELTEKTLPQPDTAREHVKQIALMSRAGIKSLDEIVWAVNPRNDTLQDLLDYAGQYAVDYLQAAGIRCRVDFPTSPLEGSIPADVRHGLFLAVKEALHNVVKHAQAKEVWLRVAHTESRLRLVIEDDGRGFAQEPADALADGLRNMRQRLAEMGGVCSIEGRPGAGVRISFEVPWRNGRASTKADF